MKNKKKTVVKSINKNPKNKTFVESIIQHAVMRAVGGAIADEIRPYVDMLIEVLKNTL